MYLVEFVFVLIVDVAFAALLRLLQLPGVRLIEVRLALCSRTLGQQRIPVCASSIILQIGEE